MEKSNFLFRKKFIFQIPVKCSIDLSNYLSENKIVYFEDELVDEENQIWKATLLTERKVSNKLLENMFSSHDGKLIKIKKDNIIWVKRL